MSCEGNCSSVADLAKNTGMFLIWSSFAVHSWWKVAALYTPKANIISAINECCIRVLHATPACQDAVVKLWGTGLTISNVPDLCGSGLQIAQTTISSQFSTNILLGSALMLIPVGFIGKKVYDCCKKPG